MALRIQCPSCRAVNRYSDDERGRKIRCAECDAPIRVPDERDDDQGDESADRRPRRKPARSSGGMSTTAWVLIGGGAAVFVFLAAIAGFAVMLFAVNPGGRHRGFGQQARNEQGKIIFEKRSFLGEIDPPDPSPHLRGVDARMKVHNVTLKPGKTYVFRLDSDEFDSYLRLESPTGAKLAEDDDGGGDLNSRIVHRPAQGGVYRVIATSLDGNFGAFQLTVWEAD